MNFTKEENQNRKMELNFEKNWGRKDWWIESIQRIDELKDLKEQCRRKQCTQKWKAQYEQKKI